MQGVLYSHRANFLQSFTMSMPDACCLTSATTVLAIVPMFHANSWALAFGAPMFGSKLVLPGTIILPETHLCIERTAQRTDSYSACGKELALACACFTDRYQVLRHCPSRHLCAGRGYEYLPS